MPPLRRQRRRLLLQGLARRPRARSNSLLLQKAEPRHRRHPLRSPAGTPAASSAWASLSVYGDVTDRRDRSGELDAGLVLATTTGRRSSQTGLNPVVDVEDVSMVMMTLDNGVQASYEQCHFTPGLLAQLHRHRHRGAPRELRRHRRRRRARSGTAAAAGTPQGDREYPIDGVEDGHADADLLTMAEFLASVALGEPTDAVADRGPRRGRRRRARHRVAPQRLRPASTSRRCRPPPSRTSAAQHLRAASQPSPDGRAKGHPMTAHIPTRGTGMRRALARRRRRASARPPSSPAARSSSGASGTGGDYDAAAEGHQGDPDLRRLGRRTRSRRSRPTSRASTRSTRTSRSTSTSPRAPTTGRSCRPRARATRCPTCSG